MPLGQWVLQQACQQRKVTFWLIRADRVPTTLESTASTACVDGFGTGYSSLSRLRQFPIDTPKIDTPKIDTPKIDYPFIHAINEKRENAEIAQAIVALIHNLEMDVVAEGIETTAQWAALK